MDCFVCSIVRGNPHLREHEAARWLTAISQRLVHRLPVDFRTFALGEARRYELGVIGGRHGLVALVVEEGQCLHAAEFFILPILNFPVKYRKAVQEWIHPENRGPCYLFSTGSITVLFPDSSLPQLKIIIAAQMNNNYFFMSLVVYITQIYCPPLNYKRVIHFFIIGHPITCP